MESTYRIDSPRRRPRLGLHLATWVVLVCLASCLAALQIGSTQWLFKCHGWPLTFCREAPNYSDTFATFQVDWELYDFDRAALELDIGMSLLLMAAMVVAVEGWLRRERRWQIRLGDLVALVFTASVMAGEYFGALNAFELANRLGISPSDNFPDAPWWIKAPVYFSAACLVFVTGRAIAWLVHQTLIGAMIVDPPAIEQPLR